MGAKIRLAKDVNTTNDEARLVAPVRRRPAGAHDEHGRERGTRRWRIYTVLGALAMLAALAVVLLASGGEPAKAQQAAATPTTGAATPKAATPTAGAASPA